MPDAFISYSRQNIGFARLLKNAFDEQELDVWIDWQDIPPSADWLAEVYEAIENSDSFVFLISENSVVSDVCKLEIAHALKNHKRLIPVVVNEVEPDKVPEPLAAINWILFTEENQFTGSFQKLIESIQVDQDWVRQHTLLQRRALDWDKKNRPGSSLLRGQELKEAELFLAEAAGKDLQPTELQTTFILTSRQADVQRRRRISLAAGAGMVILFALAVMALVQRSEAVSTTNTRATAEVVALSEAHSRATAQAVARMEEHALATSQAILDDQYISAVARSLAARAETFTLEELDMGLLLAAEAVNVEDNDESRGALMNALTDAPYLQKFLVQDPVLITKTYALSPDASIFILVSNDAELLFFDTQTGNLVETVPAPHQPADWIGTPGHMRRAGVRFSQEGDRILTTAMDHSWYLWDLSERRPDPDPLNMLLDPGADIITVSDNFKVLAAEKDEEICFWEIDTGREFQCLQDYPDYYRFSNLSPDGTLFLTSNVEGEIQVWDTVTGSPLGEPYLMFNQENIKNALFSPDNTLLLATGSRMTHLWDLESGEKLTGANHEPFGSPTYKISFTQDSAAVLWDNYFKEIEATDLSNQTTIGGRVPYFPPPATISDFSFFVNPDQAVALTYRSFLAGTEIILWDMNNQFQIQRLLDNTQDVHVTTFHPTQSNLLAMAACSQPENPRTCAVDRIRIVQLTDPTTSIAELKHEGDDIDQIVFSPSGTLLALSDTSGLIQLWDWQDQELLEEFTSLSNTPAVLAFSPDGSLLAAGSSKTGASRIVLRHTGTGENIHELTIEDEVLFTLDFSEDGRTVAMAFGSQVAVWQPATSDELLFLNPVPGVEDYIALDYSPDGQYLAAGGENGLVVWDAETHEVISQPIPGQSSSLEIQSLTFSPDGSMIAAGNPSHYVSLWDPVSGRQFGPLLEGKTGQGTNAPTLVSFNADGTVLVSSTWRTEVSIWNFDRQAWTAIACSMANRSLTPEEWGTFMGDKPYEPVCE
ncbi:MAG: TIR domain-containing protein [Anaerolineales bacterium]|nr:TIR domain-containing protein [Anaerolineales bacterium]